MGKFLFASPAEVWRGKEQITNAPGHGKEAHGVLDLTREKAGLAPLFWREQCEGLIHGQHQGTTDLGED
eukprot:11920768-Alexandrium_andersonii.AAC.1